MKGFLSDATKQKERISDRKADRRNGPIMNKILLRKKRKEKKNRQERIRIEQ
jgi:hypothetical protein